MFVFSGKKFCTFMETQSTGNIQMMNKQYGLPMVHTVLVTATCVCVHRNNLSIYRHHLNQRLF